MPLLALKSTLLFTEDISLTSMIWASSQASTKPTSSVATISLKNETDVVGPGQESERSDVLTSTLVHEYPVNHTANDLILPSIRQHVNGYEHV